MWWTAIVADIRVLTIVLIVEKILLKLLNFDGQLLWRFTVQGNSLAIAPFQAFSIELLAFDILISWLFRSCHVLPPSLSFVCVTEEGRR